MYKYLECLKFQVSVFHTYRQGCSFSCKLRTLLFCLPSRESNVLCFCIINYTPHWRAGTHANVLYDGCLLLGNSAVCVHHTSSKHPLELPPNSKVYCIIDPFGLASFQSVSAGARYICSLSMIGSFHSYVETQLSYPLLEDAFHYVSIQVSIWSLIPSRTVYFNK